MRLDTAQEIERAIDALTPQHMEELYEWLDQHHPEPIDAQLKADLDAGRTSTTALIAPWWPTKPEPRNLSNGRAMFHRGNADFSNDYRAVPPSIRAGADKQFVLLKSNPRHPSLQFKNCVLITKVCSSSLADYQA